MLRAKKDKKDSKPTKKIKAAATIPKIPKKPAKRAAKPKASKIYTWKTKRGLERLRQLSMASDNFGQLAKKMHVARSTLSRWRDQDDQIAEVVRNAEDNKIDLAKSAVIQAIQGNKVTHVVRKFLPKEKKALEAERVLYRMQHLNQYKLDNPEATPQAIKEESQRLVVEAFKEVETREQIDYSIKIDEVAPDAQIALEYLKLRDPSFRKPYEDELAKARAELTKAQAQLAQFDADVRNGILDTTPVELVMPPEISDEEANRTIDEDEDDEDESQNNSDSEKDE